MARLYSLFDTNNKFIGERFLEALKTQHAGAKQGHPYLVFSLEYSSIHDTYQVMVKMENLEEYTITDKEFTLSADEIGKAMCKPEPTPTTSWPQNRQMARKRTMNHLEQNFNIEAEAPKDPVSNFLRRKFQQQQQIRRNRNRDQNNYTY